MSGPIRRIAITPAQRQALRRKKRADTAISQVALQNWFEEQYSHRPSQSTVAESLSDKYKFLDDISEPASNVRKMRKVAHPELDQALNQWVQENRDSMALTDAKIVEKANEIFDTVAEPGQAKPGFSHGWLYKFKNRHNIVLNPRRGKSEARQSLILDAVQPDLDSGNLVQSQHFVPASAHDMTPQDALHYYQKLQLYEAESKHGNPATLKFITLRISELHDLLHPQTN